MNPETKSLHIANCRICLLAPAMRDCQNCAFKIGLNLLQQVVSEVERAATEVLVTEEVAA